MIKLGLIGVGRWGSRYLETVNRMRQSGTLDAQIAYVCRRDASKMHAPPPEGTNWWLFWEDVVTWADIDGVIIATPPQTHFKIASVALTAGVPVLLEKPATLSSRDTEGLQHLAHAKKTPIMVGHIHLCSPAFLHMVKIVSAQVDQGDQVKSIQSYGLGDGPDRNYSVLWDHAPHDLSMIVRLIGNTKYNIQRASQIIDQNTSRAVWDITMSTDDGKAEPTLIRIKVGNNSTQKVRETAVTFASGKSVSYDGIAQTLSGDWTWDQPTKQLPLDAQIRTFVKLCEESKIPTSLPNQTIAGDLELSTQIARLIEEIERTA